MRRDCLLRVCPVSRGCLLFSHVPGGRLGNPPGELQCPEDARHKHLALGDLESLGNDALMSTVKAIVSLGPLPPDSGIPRAGMAHFYVPIPDKASEDIGRYLEAAYQFIKASKGPVYLHCHAGISRSGTVAIYYWARSRNVPLKEAIRAIAGKRGQVWPNKGFLCQLEDALDEFRCSSERDHGINVV